MTRKLFITGGSLAPRFIQHIAKLTGKDNPAICLIPTAVGDSIVRINAWYETCEYLPIRPHVLKTFISSYTTTRSFEDTIMSMDAIVVSGGNTVNMLAIWKAHGIDLALRKAYDSGIVMAGGSAGSLCWFENGTTDSRPVHVTKVEGLGWIKGSHSPHYDSEESRRPLYHELIRTGKLSPGYACDDYAGIHFENEKVVNAVSLFEKSKSYYVELAGDNIKETEIKGTVLATP